MRIIFLICFFPSFVAAQITDNFSDNDFSSNPTWSGDSVEFIVNSAQQLQLNNTIAGASFLSTPDPAISLADTEWHFYIKQSFSPSSGNYGRVYLTSDQQDLESPLNGYYLQFGESGNLDAVELFRQTGLISTSVARSPHPYIASSFALGVKVTRDANGNWNIYIDPNGGSAYTLEATGNDTTYLTSDYFGISTVYTASNSNKFYFDDFYTGPIIIDTVAPAIVSVSVNSDTQIDVFFNENVDLISAQTTVNYTVGNGIGSPLLATRDANNYHLVHLIFSTAFADEMPNILSISGVKDFAMNPIIKRTFSFLYYRTKFSDLVINEILFDPKTNGIDFVEIYNRSNKPIDLKTITISQFDTVNNTLINVSSISPTSYYILPHEYLVLSENQNIIKEQYQTLHPDAFLDITDLPSMNITGGTICMASGTNIIDLLIYNEGMHFPLLNETKGVSLERVDFERPSHDRTNWHSAAETVGFATPGYKNSQYNDAVETEESIKIVPEIFSPDSDGINDVVDIHYHLDHPGAMANISIYDCKGRLVRRLVRNQLLGTNGTYSWDGINEEREKSRIGIYIIYAEIIELSGNVRHYKKACVLGGKM